MCIKISKNDKILVMYFAELCTHNVETNRNL